MHQQQIEFFWPLTEQIPLDLDYSNCSRFANWTTQTITLSSGGLSNTIVNFAPATWETVMKIPSNTTMMVDKEPNFIRKLIYKLIGFKWEVN
jgi:hypothetical protein